MPSNECIITHGSIPGDNGIVDEPNLLVSSVNFTPAREKKVYKSASGCTAHLRYGDPTMAIAVDGFVLTKSGLADQEPGTVVASLANYAAPRRGFDPTEGILVLEDPSDEHSNDEIEKNKFTVMHYPHVVVA